MKNALVWVIIGALLGGGGVWLATHGKRSSGNKTEAEKPAEEKEPETHVTHDTNGNTVVNMDDETRGDLGISVANPAATNLSPEIKGYGRVRDPSPLAALVNELAAARAASAASSNELIRAKSLESQGNASARVLQSAEAAAARDALAVQSAHDRIALSWGSAIADREDLNGFLQALTSGDAAAVRVDVPSGESLSESPTAARVTSMSGSVAELQFLGVAPSLDPQTLGRGYQFLLKPNNGQLRPGEAVTAYLKLPGSTLPGAVIPRDAIVRTEGAAWVYVMNDGAEAFTRTKISLDHPVAGGWFVANGIVPGNHIVVTGAQVLLSEELKASIKAD